MSFTSFLTYESSMSCEFRVENKSKLWRTFNSFPTEQYCGFSNSPRQTIPARPIPALINFFRFFSFSANPSSPPTPWGRLDNWADCWGTAVCGRPAAWRRTSSTARVIRSDGGPSPRWSVRRSPTWKYRPVWCTNACGATWRDGPTKTRW